MRYLQYQCHTCDVVAPRDDKRAHQHRDEHRARVHDGMIPEDEIVSLVDETPQPILFLVLVGLVRAFAGLLAGLLKSPPARRFLSSPRGQRVAGMAREWKRLLAVALICVLAVWFVLAMLGKLWRAMIS